MRQAIVLVLVLGSMAAVAQEEELAPVIVNSGAGPSREFVGEGAPAPSASVQRVPAIPAWMQPFFADNATTSLPATDLQPAKHNAFIGYYTAQVTIRTPEGITQRLFLSAWQDSTRGVMQLELVRGIAHTTWFADIGANVAVVANAIGRTAVVSDLKDVLLVDRLREPGALREFRELPLKDVMERERIAGETCTHYDLVEGTDTVELWIADDLTHSPFADGPAWIPMNKGPLKMFRLLFKFGDHAVFRFALEPLLQLEILEFRPETTPPPVIDLQHYQILPASLRTGP